MCGAHAIISQMACHHETCCRHSLLESCQDLSFQVHMSFEEPVLIGVFRSTVSIGDSHGSCLCFDACASKEPELAMTVLTRLPGLQAARLCGPTPFSRWMRLVAQHPPGKQHQALARGTPAACCTALSAGCSRLVVAHPLSPLPCPMQQSPGTCSLTLKPRQCTARGGCSGDVSLPRY